MKIVGIGGSLRGDSYTYKILKQSLNYVKKAGWETELIDLRLLELPFCSGGTNHHHHSDVKLLRNAVQSAQGIILVTPEYHGSMSGVLKNALDLLDEKDIEGKVIATIAILGGTFGYGSTSALTHVCRQLHAWVVPRDMLIPNAEKAFNKKGQLKDREMKKRLEEMLELMLDAVERLGPRI